MHEQIQIRMKKEQRKRGGAIETHMIIDTIDISSRKHSSNASLQLLMLVLFTGQARLISPHFLADVLSVGAMGPRTAALWENKSSSPMRICFNRAPFWGTCFVAVSFMVYELPV
jgi:hypothetical protein